MSKNCMSEASITKAPYAHEMRKGDSYEGMKFSVSSELNQQFLYALEEFDHEYVVSSGPGAKVHPVILLHMSARTRSPSFHLPENMGSVFARDRVKFLAPARVGETLAVSWQIVDVYEKRGRVYQALETHITGNGGQKLLTREAHSVFYMKNINNGGGAT